MIPPLDSTILPGECGSEAVTFFLPVKIRLQAGRYTMIAEWLHNDCRMLAE
jgi:hypothetical protein